MRASVPLWATMVLLATSACPSSSSPPPAPPSPPCLEPEGACVVVRAEGGSCREEPRPDGTRCELGDACALPGECVAGRCVSPGPIVCESGSSCVVATCEGSRGCQQTPRPDGTACDDGDPCTTGDACLAGRCEGEALRCEGAGPCETVGCDPETGGCLATPMPDGTACDDGLACTGQDACVAGHCRPRRGGCGALCFRDVTLESGLEGVILGGVFGGGVAILDANEDGVLDLAVAGEPAVLRLFLGRGDGTFVDASAGSGLVAVSPGVDPPSPGSHRPFAMPQMVLAADLDGDGHEDLYVLRRGENRFFRGLGDGTFVDRTDASGLGGGLVWSMAAAVGDIDGDGDLDVYVGNYIRTSGPPAHIPERNQLFLNQGDGTFVDVTTSALAGRGTTLSVAFIDDDDDGDLDLFVCNDFGHLVEPNRLYRNDGDGRFVEQASAEGFDLAFYCMGIGPGDYDHDGDLDFYVTNLGPNALLERRGSRFEDVAALRGVALDADACSDERSTTSWAGLFFDADLDGWLDLYVGNGFVGDPGSAMEDPNRIFHHQGASLTFVEVGSSGLEDIDMARGAALGDLDGDGDLDLVQMNARGRPVVLLNESPRRGGFLRVRLEGPAAYTLGATVSVELPGGVRRYDYLRQTGFGGTHAPEMIIGLGDVERVPVLRATFRNGTVAEAVDVSAGSTLILRVPD